MYTYKTKDGGDLTIVGVGQTVNGQIESDTKIENPNLELVMPEDEVTPVEPPAPNHIEAVAPQSTQGEHKANIEGIE